MPRFDVDGLPVEAPVGGVRIFMPGTGPPNPAEQLWHLDHERSIILRVWTPEQWGRLAAEDRPMRAQPLAGIGWSLVTERPPAADGEGPAR